ncbi:hypothetical protein COBT_002254 [Conglomerata obtusa]
MSKTNVVKALNKELESLANKNKEVYIEFINNMKNSEALIKQAKRIDLASVSFGRKANSTKNKFRMKYYKYAVYLIVFVTLLIILITLGATVGSR